MLTKENLQTIAPRVRDPQLWTAQLNAAMLKYDINTPQRIASFLAQILHESGEFRYTREIWGPTPAQFRYEGRKDLGNTEKGDGKRYMGRGLLQITGRANYKKTGEGMGLPLLLKPEMLEEPQYAALSAAWWWHDRNLNGWADRYDFIRITKIINGGMNGYNDRVNYYSRSKEALF